MNKKLEIRAAKALGWYKNSYGGYAKPNSNYVYPPSELEFTTSFDWAMLGVKKCQENQRDIARLIWDREAENIIHSSHDLENWLLLSPEQITRAWVEVLEKGNE